MFLRNLPESSLLERFRILFIFYIYIGVIESSHICMMLINDVLEVCLQELHSGYYIMISNIPYKLLEQVPHENITKIGKDMVKGIHCVHH